MDDSSRAPDIENTRFTSESREVKGGSKELKCSNAYMVIFLLLNYINIKVSPFKCEMVCMGKGASGSTTGLYGDEILEMITTVMSYALGNGEWV